MSFGRISALCLLGGVFIMEGFDIAAMALAVPRLGGVLGLEPAAFGWVFTALLVGLGAGGAIIAPLGDRLGRRVLIVGGCLATGLATLATASATSITEFLVWRLITGIALGACLPNVSALSAELAPQGMRATVMALVSAGIPLGLGVAGLIAPVLVGTFGWQGLFYTPGTAAVLLAAALWLVLEGGLPHPASDQAYDSTRNQAGDAAQAAKATVAPVAEVAPVRWPQLELLRAPWAFPFAVFSIMLALNALNLYLLSSWLPTILPEAGLTLDDAARISGIVQLAGLGIGIGASVLVDRWHPGLTLIGLFGLMAACFVLVGITAPDPLRWTLLLSVGVGGASAGGMVLPGLCAWLFPARLLSTAVGVGVLVARLGAFAGPPLGSAMIASKVPTATFLATAALPALACAIMALLVPAALRVRKRVETTPARLAPLSE